jgi:alkanesulfonate monooxygenase SsuD/methylene tetrahydromethanopterin reductase-like flavin-dependent oxidoreductase (luciferase family)
MLISVKLAPTYDYPVLAEFWRTADQLGFHGIWDYDHFYGLVDPQQPTYEGWTTLAAMAAQTSNSRVGCLVGSVTYHNPALLAKMAVTIDHISGGRAEFGLGAGLARTRTPRLRHRLPGSRRAGGDARRGADRHQAAVERGFRHPRRPLLHLRDAVANPKPLQHPHPPIVIGGSKPKMLRVIARHADEWNMAGGQTPDEWAKVSADLDAACAEVGRPREEIRRGVQLFLHPKQPEQIDKELDTLAAYGKAGCQHVVLSFYQPPDAALLQRCATLI